MSACNGTTVCRPLFSRRERQTSPTTQTRRPPGTRLRLVMGFAFESNLRLFFDLRLWFTFPRLVSKQSWITAVRSQKLQCRRTRRPDQPFKPRYRRCDVRVTKVINRNQVFKKQAEMERALFVRKCFMKLATILMRINHPDGDAFIARAFVSNQFAPGQGQEDIVITAYRGQDFPGSSDGGIVRLELRFSRIASS